MAYRFRPVEGYVFSPKGVPVQNGMLSFKLTKTLGYTDTHQIPDIEVTATTDTNGKYTANLWCDEDSSVALDYDVKFPKADNGLPIDDTKQTFSLAYEGGGIKQLGVAIAETTPGSSVVTPDSLGAVIDSRTYLVNGNDFTPAGFPFIRSLGTRLQQLFQNTIIGQNDFSYTVPAGKRLYIRHILTPNPTGSNANVTYSIKQAGPNYRRVAGAVAANTLTARIDVGIYLLEAGEKWSFNSTVAGLNQILDAIEMSVDSPLKRALVLLTTTGQNTVYQVPVGKKAIVLPINNNLTSAFPQLLFVNDSGISVTLQTWFVPNGQTPSAGTHLLNSSAVNSANQTVHSFVPMYLVAGDRIIVNNSAGSSSVHAMLNYFEFDA